MEFTTTSQTAVRSRSVLPRIREPRPRWEEETERAWRNAPDHGPGFWKTGLWLSRDLLALFLAGRALPIPRLWADED